MPLDPQVEALMAPMAQMEMPDVPGPDDAPSVVEHAGARAHAGEETWWKSERAILFRYVTKPSFLAETPQPPQTQVWIKANGDMPDDSVLHTCLWTYASDMTLLDTTLMPHATADIRNELMNASLDHAMWFHHPFRMDEWVLYTQDTPTMAGSRGLARGLVYSADGTLVASVMQEGLIRRIRP